VKRRASLDIEAVRLIEQASPEPPPSEEACRRMSRHLAPLFAAGAGSLSLEPSVEVSEAASRSSATGLWRWQKLTSAVWGKLTLGMLTTALMAGAFWLGSVTSQGARPAAPAVLAAPALAPAPPPVRLELFRVEPESATEPVSRSRPALAARASVAKPRSATRSRHADGLAILGDVELALRRKEPRAALARLDELGKPASAQIEHLARVLRAIALCDAGRLDEGRRWIGRLSPERESSVFAARLEAACGGSPGEARVVPEPTERQAEAASRPLTPPYKQSASP